MMEEFTVKSAPRVAEKKLNVFKMHKDDTVSWTEAKMKRENDYQPWQIKLGSGRTARRFKAVKEGGVGENASYFIFYKQKNSKDTFEVCPISEWYNVSATLRYKTLTAEEAEQKFEQRNKTLNLFSVMRKNGESGEESHGDSKAFKISEMDDWDHSDADSAGSDGRDDGSDNETKKKIKKKGTKKEKPDAEDAPDEGREDSDEGDHEQKEVDYMSDISSDSSISDGGPRDETDVKDIAEEDALRELLSTDDEEDVEGSPQKGAKLSMGKKITGAMDLKQDLNGNDSEDSDSDSDDYDVDEDKMDTMLSKQSLPAQLVKQEIKQEQDPSNITTALNQRQQSSQSNSSQATTKRKPDTVTASGSGSLAQPSPKRPCPADFTSTSSANNSLEKTIEDLIRKYLSRKPMPLRNLLKDIKNKLRRMGRVTSEMDNELVNTIAIIIKRLNPDKHKINDTTYLSLKAQ